MEYRRLGRSGIKVSAVGIGANQIGGKVDLEMTRRILDRALDLGVNFIDTATTYTGGKSEEFLGEALKGRRDEFLVATKVGWPSPTDGPNEGRASRHFIMQRVELSLRRLQTDHIDLYQIHHWDADTPLEETMRALDDLVRAGKVRYLGASNFAAWQLCRANDLAEMMHLTPFVSIQPHYNMMQREIEKELVPYARAFDIGILPYRPLAGGFLTGKYAPGYIPPGSRGEFHEHVRSYFTERNFAIVEKLKAFAAERGRSMVELAVAWLLAQPQIASVINGVTTVEQLEQNVKAHTWHLTPEEDAELRSILEAQ
ncbi:MAG: aldo/keto reductase [Anaerolineae bacterium]